MGDTREKVDQCGSQRLVDSQGEREEYGRWEVVQQLLGPATARPADCGNPVSPPPWLDTHKLRRGQAVFRHYFCNVFLSNLLGLVCILAVHSILKVLTFTGRSSTPAACFRRYLGTLNHVRLWYSSDVFDPHSSAFKSIQMVRKMHSRSHTEAQKARVGLASQTDMVVTQWAFFGLVLSHGQQLGLHCTREEEESLVHFWKAVGYLLGIEDRYNLASGELEEVRAKCRAVLEAVIVEGLRRPQPQFSTMADSMLQGVHMIIPAVDPPAIMAFTYHLLGLHHDTSNLSWYSTLVFNHMIWNYRTALHLPVIGELSRIYQNNLLSFALFVCNSLPSLASYYQWTENSLSILYNLLTFPTRALKGIILLFIPQKL